MVINILIEFSHHIFNLLYEMAPYLLIGFGFAGLLSVIVSQEKIPTAQRKLTLNDIMMSFSIKTGKHANGELT